MFPLNYHICILFLCPSIGLSQHPDNHISVRYREISVIAPFAPERAQSGWKKRKKVWWQIISEQRVSLSINFGRHRIVLTPCRSLIVPWLCVNPLKGNAEAFILVLLWLFFQSAAAAPSPVMGNMPPNDGMPGGPMPPGFFQVRKMTFRLTSSLTHPHNHLQPSPLP